MLNEEKQLRTIKFAEWLMTMSLRELALPANAMKIKRFAYIIKDIQNGGVSEEAVKESGLLDL